MRAVIYRQKRRHTGLHMHRVLLWLVSLVLLVWTAAPVHADNSVAVVRADGPRGSAMGTAVAVGPDIVVTARHVVEPAGARGRVMLTRADGAVVQAGFVARSSSIDLAVLRVPVGFLQPRELATDIPHMGARVQADGARGTVIRRVGGAVALVPFRLAGYGTGFVADLPPIPGFSGGPVIDPQGRIVGLIAAEIFWPQPARPLAAGGAARRGQVFVLGAPTIAAALRELLPR